MDNRIYRINGELQKSIYEIIVRKLKNPLVEEMFSITSVNCAADLKTADVYVSVFSGSDKSRASTFKAIKDSAKEIRRELAKIMRTRTVPELKIIYDDTEEKAEVIERLLKQINDSENGGNDNV